MERVSWAEGKNHLTRTYAWFLAGWAERMSWSDVAAAFRTTWENVFRSVEMAVQWGLQLRSLDGIESLGIDELPPTALSKSPCITALAGHRNRTSPTDSAEEPGS